MFVIDGSKALWAAIDWAYGARNPVQRCRGRKVRNVTEHLPEELKEQVRTVMTAAAFVATERNFRRIMGYEGTWLLRAALEPDRSSEEEVKAA